MLRTLLRAVAALLCASLLALLAAVCWLEFPSGRGTQRAYQLASDVWRRDPAHAHLYARAYLLLADLADGDTPHYVVHETAAALARLAGRPDLAAAQEYRAAQHRPAGGPRLP